MKIINAYSYDSLQKTDWVVNCFEKLLKMNKKVFILDLNLNLPGVLYSKIKMNNFGENKKPLNFIGTLDYFSDTILEAECWELSGFEKDYYFNNVCENGFIMSSCNPDKSYLSGLFRCLSKWNLLHRDHCFLWGQIFFKLIQLIKDEYNPDYLFIDSPVGITDIGFSSIFFLPQVEPLVVAWFNYQENVDYNKTMMATFLRCRENQNKNNLEDGREKLEPLSFCFVNNANDFPEEII